MSKAACWIFLIFFIIQPCYAGHPLISVIRNPYLNQEMKREQLSKLLSTSSPINVWEPRRALFQNAILQTPLTAAVINRDPEIIKMLIQAGAELGQPNSAGETPIMLATSQGSLGQLGTLLLPSQEQNRQATVNIKDVQGNSALNRAIQKLDLVSISWLFSHGANPDELNGKGETALIQGLRSFISFAKKNQLSNQGRPFSRKTPPIESHVNQQRQKYILLIRKLIRETRNFEVRDLNGNSAEDYLGCGFPDTQEDFATLARNKNSQDFVLSSYQNPYVVYEFRQAMKDMQQRSKP